MGTDSKVLPEVRFADDGGFFPWRVRLISDRVEWATMRDATLADLRAVLEALSPEDRNQIGVFVAPNCRNEPREERGGDSTWTESFCWHCGDGIVIPVRRERCEQCPDECDIEGCEELGCRTGREPTITASTASIVSEPKLNQPDVATLRVVLKALRCAENENEESDVGLAFRDAADYLCTAIDREAKDKP